MDKEDNNLQFTFNGSLVNKHFEKILDIIGKTIKNEKEIKKNKNTIISYLQETFPNITSEKLASGFNMLYSSIGEIPIKTTTIEEINSSITKYINFIYSTSNLFKDRGYSMLLCGYFWITRDY